MDHTRYTDTEKRRLHSALFWTGLAIIPAGKVLCMSQIGAMIGAPLLAAGPVLCVAAAGGMVCTRLAKRNLISCQQCGAEQMVERGVSSFVCARCGVRQANIPRGNSGT